MIINTIYNSNKNLYNSSGPYLPYMNFLKPFKVVNLNFNDKDHIYKKCSKCGTILKLPLQTKAGFKKAKCPKCNKKVRLFTFKKEKIEIIRGGVK